MENLFWKVIHNKILFYKIISSIENTEFIHYETAKEYNIGNRRKFKDLTLLGWFIKNREFSLLNYKLDCCNDGDIGGINGINGIGDDDCIEIDEKGLILLLSNDEYENCQYDKPIQAVSTILNKFSNVHKQIFIKLLQRKPLEMKQFDLINLAITSSNLEALELLTNEPYSIPVNVTIILINQFMQLKQFAIIIAIIEDF